MSKVQIRWIDRGNWIEVSVPVEARCETGRVHDLRKQIAELCGLREDAQVLLSADGRKLNPARPLSIYDPNLILISQALVQQGSIHFPMESSALPSPLPSPVASIDRGSAERQEKLYSIAKRAQTISVILRDAQTTGKQTLQHCRMTLEAGNLFCKNKRTYIESQLSKADVLLRSLQEHESRVKSAEYSLSAKLQTLKSVPLHPALVLEDRKNLGDLVPDLQLAACKEKLGQTLNQLRSKATSLSEEIHRLEIVPDPSPVPVLMSEEDYEPELKLAEDVIRTYTSFRGGLESRRPIDNVVTQSQFSAMGNMMERLEGRYERGMRYLEGIRDVCQAVAGYFQQTLSANLLQTSRIKERIQAPAHLLKSLLFRSNQFLEFLQTPMFLEESYTAMVSEVSRRRKFAKTAVEMRRILISFIDEETSKREEFCERYGKTLPCSFIPQLSDAPDNIYLQPRLDNDHQLPTIDLPGEIPAEIDWKSAHSEAQKRVGQLEETLRNKEQALSTALSQTSDETQKLADLKAKYEQLKTDFSALQGKFSALYKEKQEITEQAKTLSVAYQNSRVQIQQLVAEMQRKENADLMSARSTIQALTSERTALERAIEDLRSSSTTQLHSSQLEIDKLTKEIDGFRKYAQTLSIELTSLRSLNEKINNESKQQEKLIAELKLKLQKATESSSLLESFKVEADASTAELREKMNQLKALNYKLRKKLQQTIHFTDFPEQGLALFFPDGQGHFAALHCNEQMHYLNSERLPKANEEELR